MTKSKAFSLLKTFSKDEFREFGKFVISPFFNTEKVHHRLYGLLKQHYPHFPEEKFGKEQVYKFLYPGRDYNDGAMRNILSDFLSLEIEYIRFRGLKKDEFYNDHFLMLELMERKEEVLFMKTKIKTEKLLSGSFKTAQYFHKQFLLAQIEEIMNIRTHDSYLRGEYDLRLQENMLCYVVLQMIYINSKFLIANKLTKDIEKETAFENEITAYLEGKGRKLLGHTYVNSYYLMYKLLKTNDRKYFFELNSFISSKYREIEPSTLSSLFTSLENFAIEKINSGEFEFYRELFTIYKIMTEQRLYLGGFGHMRHIFYLNTVSIGLEAGEYKWIEMFIENYRNEIYEEFREASYNMASAILYYWKKDYNKSIEFASKVSSDDFAFKVNIRSLYLKIYYDLNETESFLSHIDSFKHYYAGSKEVSKEFRLLFADYVKYSKKLFELKNNPEEYEIKKVKQEIIGNKTLLNKTWLIKKVKELEKS